MAVVVRTSWSFTHRRCGPGLPVSCSLQLPPVFLRSPVYFFLYPPLASDLFLSCFRNGILTCSLRFSDFKAFLAAGFCSAVLVFGRFLRHGFLPPGKYLRKGWGLLGWGLPVIKMGPDACLPWLLTLASWLAILDSQSSMVPRSPAMVPSCSAMAATNVGGVDS
jgi:hypothetical protein